MVRIGVDPDMLDLGVVTLTWVGFFTLAGIAVGVFLVVLWGRRSGLSPGQIYRAAIWTVLCGFVGARLLHVIDFWSFYRALPGQAFYIWSGGLALWGGVLGGALGGLLYAGWRRMPVRRVADVGALAALVGQAVGRVGDLISGERLAEGTSWPWSFAYTNPESASYASPAVEMHPAALYELLWDLAVFGLLWRLRKRLRPEGALFLSYLVLYAVGRLLISLVRVERVWWGGLQQDQVVALAVLVSGATVLWLLGPRLVRAGAP